MSAEFYERGEGRWTYRNGYKSRQKRTRKVSKTCEEVSHERVSHYTRELDEVLSAWWEWRLDEETSPYVIVDARYERRHVWTGGWWM